MSDRHAINLTAAWNPPPARGSGARWQRQFGLPAGLAADDRVWLAVASPAGCRLELNGTPLGPVPAGAVRRREVTTLLRRRNDLVMAVDEAVGVAPAGADGHGRRQLPDRLGRVWLEIEPTA